LCSRRHEYNGLIAVFRVRVDRSKGEQGSRVRTDGGMGRDVDGARLTLTRPYEALEIDCR
jgi:hypothetical protein